MLSNTIWTRDYHRGLFERDGVLDLVDADVYSSEIALGEAAPARSSSTACATGGRRAGSRRLRRRPRLRGRARPAVGRDARDPGAAQRHPGEPAGRVTTRHPTPWRTSCSTSSTSSTALVRTALTRHARRHGGPDTAHRRLRRARPRFVAGWVDAVVGGGGLVQLPALLLGVPDGVAGADPRDQQVQLDLRDDDQRGDLLPARPPGPAHRPADGRRRVRRGGGRRAASGCTSRRPRSTRSSWSARRRRRLHAPQARARPGDRAALERRTSTGGGDAHRVRHRGLRRRARTRYRLVPRLRPRRADGIRVPRGQRQGQDRQRRDQPRRARRLRPGRAHHGQGRPGHGRGQPAGRLRRRPDGGPARQRLRPRRVHRRRVGAFIVRISLQLLGVWP